MTNDRDPILQELFASPVQELAGDRFVDEVMTRTRRRTYALFGTLATLMLALVVSVLLAPGPALSWAKMLTGVLTTPLFDLGEGWLAWFLLPVNSFAGLLVISGKIARMAWKKTFGLRTIF